MNGIVGTGMWEEGEQASFTAATHFNYALGAKHLLFFTCSTRTRSDSIIFVLSLEIREVKDIFATLNHYPNTRL
jgi:hypothetical protein